MTARDFPRFDETNAPEATRAALLENKRLFGAVPEPLARYAGSPQLLGTALSSLHQFEQTSLAALEREVVAMAMGRLNGCKFCLALHRKLLRAQKASPELIDALEQGRALAEPRLEALRAFVLAVVDARGDVPEREWIRFREAGFSHAQALEVVLGIGAYTLTTLANRLTEV